LLLLKRRNIFLGSITSSMRLVTKQHTIIASLIIFIVAIVFPLITLGATSTNFQLNQEGTGFVEFDGSSTNFQFKSVIGGPAGQLSRFVVRDPISKIIELAFKDKGCTRDRPSEADSVSKTTGSILTDRMTSISNFLQGPGIHYAL